jgi:site-specific recombinase XerD
MTENDFSHATIALAAGTDLKTISAALGYYTISVTANTYLHAVEPLEKRTPLASTPFLVTQ